MAIETKGTCKCNITTFEFASQGALLTEQVQGGYVAKSSTSQSLLHQQQTIVGLKEALLCPYVMLCGLFFCWIAWQSCSVHAYLDHYFPIQESPPPRPQPPAPIPSPPLTSSVITTSHTLYICIYTKFSYVMDAATPRNVVPSVRICSHQFAVGIQAETAEQAAVWSLPLVCRQSRSTHTGAGWLTLHDYILGFRV